MSFSVKEKTGAAGLGSGAAGVLSAVAFPAFIVVEPDIGWAVDVIAPPPAANELSGFLSAEVSGAFAYARKMHTHAMAATAPKAPPKTRTLVFIALGRLLADAFGLRALSVQRQIDFAVSGAIGWVATASVSSDLRRGGDTYRVVPELTTALSDFATASIAWRRSLPLSRRLPASAR